MKLKKKELSQLIESLLTEGNDKWWKNLKTDTEYGDAKVAIEVNPTPKGYYAYYAFADADGNPVELYKLPDGEEWYYDAKQPLVKAAIKEDDIKKRVYIYHPENKPAGIE